MHPTARCLLLAGATLVAAQAGSSQVNCITAVGPKPVSVIETTTAESTSTVSISDATTTAVVTETSTAVALTETDITTVEVTTTTTENTVTDTYTSTSTEIDTATTTITQTETTTTTVSETTTTTDNTVIATPSGFVPIADTQNGYPARKRDSHRRHCHKPVAKPSVYPTPIVGTYDAAPTSSTSCSSSSLSTSSTSATPVPIGDGTQYPVSVECSATTTTQQTVTATSTSSTTITPAPVTTTSTTTVTSTSTEVPRASTTLTTTETSTTTTTAVETTTTTETATSTSTETATATSYAACQANNILTSYNGSPIVNVYNRGRGSATVYDYVTATTPEDCCIACVNKAGCSGSIWRPGNTYCLLMYGNGRTCASQSDNMAQFVSSAGSSSGFVLSNGLCGYQEWLAGN